MFAWFPSILSDVRVFAHYTVQLCDRAIAMERGVEDVPYHKVIWKLDRHIRVTFQACCIAYTKLMLCKQSLAQSHFVNTMIISV